MLGAKSRSLPASRPAVRVVLAAGLWLAMVVGVAMVWGKHAGAAARISERAALLPVLFAALAATAQWLLMGLRFYLWEHALGGELRLVTSLRLSLVGTALGSLAGPIAQDIGRVLHWFPERADEQRRLLRPRGVWPVMADRAFNTTLAVGLWTLLHVLHVSAAWAIAATLMLTPATAVVAWRSLRKRSPLRAYGARSLVAASLTAPTTLLVFLMVGLQVRCVLAALGGQPVTERAFWDAVPSLLVSSLVPVSALGFSAREAALPWTFASVTMMTESDALWIAAAGLLTLTSWLSLSPLLLWGAGALLRLFWVSRRRTA